jgi:hypothetical protein
MLYSFQELGLHNESLVYSLGVPFARTDALELAAACAGGGCNTLSEIQHQVAGNSGLLFPCVVISGCTQATPAAPCTGI